MRLQLIKCTLQWGPPALVPVPDILNDCSCRSTCRCCFCCRSCSSCCCCCSYCCCCCVLTPAYRCKSIAIPALLPFALALSWKTYFPFAFYCTPMSNAFEVYPLPPNSPSPLSSPCPLQRSWPFHLSLAIIEFLLLEKALVKVVLQI